MTAPVMYPLIKKLIPASVFGALCVAVAPLHAAPTDGFTQYSNTYKVQDRTTHSGSGFTSSGGVFTTIVHAGDERCEMRWADWPHQSRENQWQGDVNIDPVSQKTAIFQVKNNAYGEAIYVQITTPGTLRNDNSGTPFATGMAGKWFRMNCSHNPTAGTGRIWINGSLVQNTTFAHKSVTGFYFKNGCYNNGLPSGGMSKASFKNITFWVK